MNTTERMAAGWVIYTAFAVGWLTFLVLDHSRASTIGMGAFNVAIGTGMSILWGSRRD